MVNAGEVRISPKVFAKAIAVIYFILLSLNLIALLLEHGLDYDYAKGFVPLFHFDSEQSIATLFNVLLLIHAAIFSALIGSLKRSMRASWRFLALIFAFLALDEFGSIHEKLIHPVREFLSASKFFYFAWIIPYGIFVAVLAVILFKWLRSLPAWTQRGLVLSAIIYLTGVFILEGISGWYFEGDQEKRDLVFDSIATVEESCEMIGVTMYCYICASYLVKEMGVSRITIGEAPGGKSS